MPVLIPRCTTCFTLAHPPRALCPVCGNAGWHPEPCESGTVEECTTVAGSPPVTLASVRVPDGPVVIAALPTPAAPGTAVTLRPGPNRSVQADMEP